MDGICGLLADHNPLVPPYEMENCNHRRVEDRGIGRNRRRWLGGCATLSIAFLALAVTCLLALLLLPWVTIDYTFADVPLPSDDLRFVQVQKVCEAFDGAGPTRCRVVIDTIDTLSGSARRALFFDSGDFESEILLVPPPSSSSPLFPLLLFLLFFLPFFGSSIHNSDTRLWLPNHSLLLNEYVAALALLPFLVGSLDNGNISVPSDPSRSALIIGLGGGSLDMFLHNKFPWINITVYESDPIVAELAERWFGVVNDQTRRTVRRNGLEALNNRNGQNPELFDAIIVDACGDGDQHLTCPAPQFITHNSLGVIRSALNPLGAFILNVLPATDHVEEEAIARLQQLLLSMFPLCVRMRMGRQLNSVFACLSYSFSGADLANILPFWQAKKDRLITQLGLKLHLEGARLTAGTGP